MVGAEGPAAEAADTQAVIADPSEPTVEEEVYSRSRFFCVSQNLIQPITLKFLR